MRAFWWLVDAATPITIVILTIEVIHLLGISIPNPTAALLAAIVYSSFSAGWRAGLVSAAIATLYELLAFSSPYSFIYTWQDVIRVATFSASALTAIALAGLMKRRSEAATYSLARDWAAESLVAESAHLQGILHQLPLGVLVSDVASGEIVFANDKARSILGSDVSRIHSVGYPCICHLASGRSYSPYEWPWHRCAQLGLAIEEEFLYSRADGRLVIIRARACPIAGRDGQPIAVVMSFSDTGEHHRTANRPGEAHSPSPALEPAPC